ncbi:MAG: hypothetical protein ACREA7_07310 [Nitrosotalea sp.]
MKTIQILIIAILIAGGAILMYSTVNFELAERHFEDVRNGLVCNKPGSSCPMPDFDGPAFYAKTGLAMFSVGAAMSLFKERSKLTRLIFGITSATAGAHALILGIVAYADDYSHFESMVKNCSNHPCAAPNVFAYVGYVQFFGIFGGALLAIGVTFLVNHFRGGHTK